MSGVKKIKNFEEILKDEYPVYGKDCPSLKEYYSKNTIFNKASQLGIKKIKGKWTEEEIEILKEEYPINGTNIPELLKKYDKSAIISKAKRIGIAKKRLNNTKEKYIGKVFLQNNNSYVKIIDYEDKDNVTIQFENGTIKKGCRIYQIKKGMYSTKNSNQICCYDHFENRYESKAEMYKAWHITRGAYNIRIKKMSKKEALETPFFKVNGFNIKNTELFLDNKNKIFGNMYFCTCKKCNAPVTGWGDEIISKKCPECGK